MSTPTALVAGRYRLIKLLGAGGMGVVWQAWDERLHRTVALKMLRAQPDLTEQEREIITNRAMREARITAGLHHPNAVTVFDVVEHDGQPCLVMQLIESTPLSALLKEHGSLTPLEAARIGAPVSSALAAAHRLRIVHRDVKPGNILITEDGSAMISDFGISHALGDPTITATGMIHGTPAYLAPEVARGQESKFASDVFSLGSTLYAMVEGAPPFGAENNAMALLHKVASGSYPAPRNAGVLAPLLREMLSADPRQRPDMATVATRLFALQRSLSAAAGDPAPGDSVGMKDESWETVPMHQSRRYEAPTVEAPMAGEATVSEATVGAAPVGAAMAGDAPPAATTSAGQPPAADPAGSVPTSPPPPAPRPPRHRRRLGALAGILLVAAIVIVGVLMLTNPLREGTGDAGGLSVDDSPGTTAPPTPADTPTPSATTLPSAEAEPSDIPSASAPPEQAEEEPASAEQQLVDAVTTYYALLPGDLDSAWAMMTADYQVNHVGGRAAFEDFWGRISNVTTTDVSASAPDEAQATLTYSFTDGRVVQEVTEYRLVDAGGTLKIAATTVLSSTAL